MKTKSDIYESFNFVASPIGVKDGWMEIVFDLFKEMKTFCVLKKIDCPKVYDVKQKLGELDISTEKIDELFDPNDAVLIDFIRKAQTKASITCEYCGRDGFKRLSENGKIHVVCDECKGDDDSSPYDYSNQLKKSYYEGTQPTLQNINDST